MLYQSDDAERTTIMRVAELMVTAARTAPKASGTDHLYAVVADGEEKVRLAEEMRRCGKLWNQEFVARDGNNVDTASCIVLLGALVEPLGLQHCGYCGFPSCGASVKAGGRCAHNLVDLGIAIGSAVSVAADNRIDNRVLYSAGRVAMEMGLLPPVVKVAVGIPLAAYSKSPFFDRGSEDSQRMLKRISERKSSLEVDQEK